MVTVSFLVEKEKVESLKNAVSAVYDGRYLKAFLISEDHYEDVNDVFVNYTLTEFSYSAFEKIKAIYTNHGENGLILYWTTR